MEKKIIQVEEKVPVKLLIPLSIQHMFAMFGASVLVPFLFGINPAIVLLMNGVGTLLFIVITKGKAPAYLGSSFAFLSPALLVIERFGYAYALGGFVVLGIGGMIVALIIGKCGTKWIDIVLPTAAMGPVVALIGLELAGNAADTAGLLAEKVDIRNVIVFLVTLGVAVFGQILFRGFLSVIPILIAIIAGYLAAAACGILEFDAVREAAFFALPNFQTPKFHVEAILTILPALLLVTSEHIGHQIVTGKIVGRDLLKDPGLHRSLFADFFSTTLSGLCGSVPTTTYGENIGVMAVTKVYSVQVIGGAAVTFHLLLFLWQAGCVDQHDSRAGHRRNFFPALWHDRNLRPAYAGRWKGGLQQVQKSDADIGSVRCGTFQNCPESGRCSADWYGAGMHRCHGAQPGLLCAGPAETDQRQRGRIRKNGAYTRRGGTLHFFVNIQAAFL